MTSKNLYGFLVAVFALVALTASASAFGDITSVKVDGVEALNSDYNFANLAGERVELLVKFVSDDGDFSDIDNELLADDVRLKVELTGETGYLAVSNRQDIYENGVYTFRVIFDVPSDLDEDLTDSRGLMVSLGNSGTTISLENPIAFRVERESYNLEILAINMQSEITAGDSLAIDVVLKNKGSHFADDAFLKIRIPELGLETQTYFGDLSAQDTSDKEDAVERRTYLKLPVDVPAGLYTVQLEAFNDDSYATAEKRILVSGASEEALVLPSEASKTFAVGETGEYKLTIVNRGSSVSVYRLSVDAPSDLNVALSDTLIVVPAGSSRTFSVFADSQIRDDYAFSVKVASEEGALVTQETLTADVTDTGSRTSGSVAGSANATVLLTVILAIIFVVLLVVLIVLLTRKPETKEEFGESYY